jgi:hypothetical protein
VRPKKETFSAVQRSFLRDGLGNLFHIFTDFFDLWMHLADELMFLAGKFFDAARLLMQFLKHCVLAAGDAMHPPKTDSPANRPDKTQNQREMLVVHGGKLA